eukprot:5586275-Prymnesium_polylepis.1
MSPRRMAAELEILLCSTSHAGSSCTLLHPRHPDTYQGCTAGMPAGALLMRGSRRDREFAWRCRRGCRSLGRLTCIRLRL